MNLLPSQQIKLLILVARIVPAADRAEWFRFWKAELWCHQQTSHGHASTDLQEGIIRDALWLRMESCRCGLRGTALLCLLTILLVCTLALLLALCSMGGWQTLTAHFNANYGRFLFASPLVLLVTYSTASRRVVHATRSDRCPTPSQTRLLRLSFFAAKAALVFALAYLLGVALCAPIAAPFPNTAAFLQVLLYVIFSVIALRWCFEDQQQRCRHCLRLLKAPARVGRPSHNLLEWSGTALVCLRGHGVLSVPELETSWHQTSEWSQAIANPFTPRNEQLA